MFELLCRKGGNFNAFLYARKEVKLYALYMFHGQKAELQQRVMCCNEEVHIVARESKDMVLNYKQLFTSLQSALEERCLGNTCLLSGTQDHSPLDCDFKQHYIEGRMHMLSGKLLQNEHLLSQASTLLDKLQHALRDQVRIASFRCHRARRLDVA